MLQAGDKVQTTLNDEQGVVLSVDTEREAWETVEVRTNLGVIFFAENLLTKIR